MNHSRLAIAVVVAALLVQNGSVLAQSTDTLNCTPWADQRDGTSFTICVHRTTGHRSCWRISNAPGSVAYQVPCN
jgi:hypothetical protein